MKNKITLLLFIITLNVASAQYVAFFKFNTKQPAAIVSTMSDMMETDWGKNLPAKVYLLDSILVELIKHPTLLLLTL